MFRTYSIREPHENSFSSATTSLGLVALTGMHLPLLHEAHVPCAHPDLAGSACLQIVGIWHWLPDKASVSFQTLGSHMIQPPLVVLSELCEIFAGYLAGHVPSLSLAAPGPATKRHEWCSPAALAMLTLQKTLHIPLMLMPQVPVSAANCSQGTDCLFVLGHVPPKKVSWQAHSQQMRLKRR